MARQSLLVCSLLVLAAHVANASPAKNAPRFKRVGMVGVQVDRGAKGFTIVGRNRARLSSGCAPTQIEQLGGRVTGIKASAFGGFQVAFDAAPASKLDRLGRLAEKVSKRLPTLKELTRNNIRLRSRTVRGKELNFKPPKTIPSTAVRKRVEYNVTLEPRTPGLKRQWAEGRAWRQNPSQSFDAWAKTALK